METVKHPVERKASSRALRAGMVELKEANGLSFKLKYLEQLLADGLDSNDEFDMYLLDTALRPSREYNRIMCAHAGSVVGIEFLCSDAGFSDRCAVVLRSASEVGKFAVYYFDTNGFSRHHVEDTENLAAQTMVREGFVHEAPGALDRFSSTPAWKRGIAWTELCMQYSRRQITLDELNTKQCELGERYPVAKAVGEGDHA